MLEKAGPTVAKTFDNEADMSDALRPYHLYSEVGG